MDTRDWIFLSILFYLGVLAGTSAYAFLLRRASVFEPIGQYLFFMSLFALPLPIRAWLTPVIEGNVSPYLPQFESYIPISLILTALALPTFALAYYSRFARRWGDRWPRLVDRSLRGTRIAALLLVALSAMLIYLLTKEIGGLTAFLLLGYKSSEATFGRGYLAIGFPWLIVGMLGFLERWKSSRKLLDLLGFGALLVTNLLFNIVTGNRGLLMYMAIALLIFIHFRIRRMSAKALLPIAVAGFLLLNIIGYVRNSDYQSLADFVEKTTTTAQGVTTPESNSFFYTLTIGEFVVPFETLPQMIRTVGITETPWLGLSYVRAPLYFIPSFIFPDRPDSLGYWYMNTFYGGGFGLNEGRAFFFLAEGYLNFGPFGVLMIAAAWGLFWGALHRWMLRGKDRMGTVLIYALSVAFMFRCIAGDFGTLLVGLFEQSLLAVAVLFAVSRVFGSRRKPMIGRTSTVGGIHA